MPTTTFVDGSVLRLEVSTDGGTTYAVVFHAQQGTIEFTKETTNIITKDTGGGQSWREIKTKTKQAVITVNGLIFYAVNGTTQFNVEELIAMFVNDTQVDFTWSTGVAGDPIYSGKAYVTRFREDAQADTESSFEATLDVDGAPTIGTVV